MTAALTTTDLGKTYRSAATEVHALRGTTLEIPEGEITVLLGASGSGKSTFLNIIGGLDRPTAGTVHFRGVDLTKLSDSQLTDYRRNNVGFVFQFYNLMPSLTARENVALVTDIAVDPMNADEVLAMVGLAERAGHFPSQLSGGEQQRVAIARAIAKRPEILLCDEPTGALDSRTGKEVLKAIERINAEQRTTVCLITHNAAIAGMAHRVIHFTDGQVREVVTNAHRAAPDDIEW